MTNATANILESFRLDNKVALVTGSASGLGAAIAIALAQAGATVACDGNRRAATETAATFGRVDILINNAGTILRAPAEEVTLEDWQLVLQVNLTSVFQLSQLAARD